MRTTLRIAFVAVLTLGGCGEVAPTAAPIQPAPSQPASSATDPIPVGRCPERGFDGAIVLGPVFQQEFFLHDESRKITDDFIERVEDYYDEPTEFEPCSIFTERGLEAARLIDARLRAVDGREIEIEGDLILRVAFEGEYDLRERPPSLPIDAIYDLAPGAVIRDRATNDVRVTTGLERIGFHYDLMFDGHTWRADGVAPIGPDYAEWAVLPRAVLPGPRCRDLRRDPPDTPFDELSGASLLTSTEGRRWCDADGRGRLIQEPEQLVLLTRFPCERGRAAVLNLGRPLGSRLDPLVRWEYVRDPAGEFLVQGWLTAPYDGDSTLPDDAVYTGWTNGNIELWINDAELDAAVYVVRDDTVERWPRAADQWGVTDCN